jgi:hypothetical protein
MELSDATEKTPATPGIDPGTFRLVVQCLNHYATPQTILILHEMSGSVKNKGAVGGILSNRHLNGKPGVFRIRNSCCYVLLLLYNSVLFHCIHL